MENWYELLQSIFIGLLFAYLLAKLISILVAFKQDNLSVTRDQKLEDDSSPSESVPGGDEADSLIAEQGSVGSKSNSDSDEEEEADDDDDDWEGVESTELDEAFSAATMFVATAAADRLSEKVPNDVQLQLYGLYKIATEGPCSSPQPSALKMTTRAKWQAWHKLGAMTPEEAMEKYLDIVTELYPSWLSSATKAKARGRGDDAPSSDGKQTMGPVFSSFIHEEESEHESTMDAIHAFAREGEFENLLNCIETGVPVNARDSEGRTALHWAVDRGHLNIVEALVSKKADVNAKDNEGQTPLHYAAVCDREAIAEFLVKQNSDINVRDNDGDSPLDLCESDWKWIKTELKQ